jgi:hypothetical protein
LWALSAGIKWTSYIFAPPGLNILRYCNSDYNLHDGTHVIKKMSELHCIYRRGKVAPKSDDLNKKDEDKDDTSVREFEEDTNDRYAE